MSIYYVSITLAITKHIVCISIHIRAIHACYENVLCILLKLQTTNLSAWTKFSINKLHRLQ